MLFLLLLFQICNCRQTAGNKAVVDICNEFLLDNTEHRMNDIACKFQ